MTAIEQSRHHYRNFRRQQVRYHPTQDRLWAFIKQRAKADLPFPTKAEICTAMGWGAPQQTFLDALWCRGKLDRSRAKSGKRERVYSVSGAGWAEIRAEIEAEQGKVS
jgi:hypothetical protein